MNNKTLNLLIENNDFLNKKINFYIDKKTLTNTTSKYEIKGHLDKARHNLSFLGEIKQEFNDWSLVVCYYAIYHSALALILSKKFYSKNHDATICILIKEFYNIELTKEDIDLLNMFDIQDVLFYAEAKNKREEANYSTKTKFDLKEVETIKLKTRLFVNKAERILKN
jgi:uncharacterized protein (UPF0332 family)